MFENYILPTFGSCRRKYLIGPNFFPLLIALFITTVGKPNTIWHWPATTHAAAAGGTCASCVHGVQESCLNKLINKINNGISKTNHISNPILP